MERPLIEIQTDSVECADSRIGLRQGRTSVPVFLVAIPKIEKIRLERMEYAGQIVEKVQSSSTPEEAIAWQAVLAFFQAGGKLAWVFSTPWEVDETSVLSSLRDALIGKGAGLRRSTGLRGMDRLSGYADLICIPQLTNFDGASHDWRAIVEEGLSAARTIASGFLLLDLPLGATPEDACDYARELNSERGACFYPHFFSTEQLNPIPCSSIVASVIQRIAKEKGITESAANLPLRNLTRYLNWLPSRQLSPAQITFLNYRGVNCFRVMRDGREEGTRIWGFLTLDKESEVSSVRAKLLLQDAIESICESFVFGPVSDHVCEEVELSVENFLHGMKPIFDGDPEKAYGVSCTKRVAKHEPILDVHCWFRLPHTVNRVSVDLHVNA